MTVLAPATPRAARRRRAVVWAVIGVGVVIVAIVAALLSQASQWTQRDALDPASAAPGGTRAIAEVLRAQGIDVQVVRDRSAAQIALEAGPATLVLSDAPALSDDAVTALAAPAAQVVLVQPRARTLRLLLPGAAPAGRGADRAAPSCSLAAAERAGSASIGGLLSAGDDLIGCYPSGDGFGLVASGGARAVVALDGSAVLANESLATAGNAALAVNLLGAHPVVVWYVPSLGDTDLADSSPTLGELTPPWVSPVIVLLLLAGIAAAVWRGRRFGPLVAERMPVSVRVGETTEGRARLYARAGDSGHAAVLLRQGALERLGVLLALGRGASPADVADAASARTGLPRTDVHQLLHAWQPHSDADLVLLHTRLRDLENAVRTSILIERNPR